MKGFIARHPDPDMRQMPRNAWSHGGYVRLRINVQEGGQQRANLLFGEAYKHGSASILIADIE
jgi:hypothetical protein